ncbi:MAG TPA: hypothetical protein VGK81_04795 [Anaerolineae bacterium]
MTQTALTAHELADSIIGLVVYDRSDHKSGLHDDQLKARVRQMLRAMPEAERRRMLAQVAIELYLSEEALKRSAGLEDVAAFWEWLVFNRMV